MADDVRSFVDLRAFAAAATLPEAFDGDGFLSRRAWLPLPAGPVRVAALALVGAGHVADLPADEFMIVLSGNIRLGDTALAPGESAVLPAGSAFSWTATSDCKAIVMNCAGKPGAGAIVPIDREAPLDPSAAPLADLLVGPIPSCRNHTDYRSASGEFVCGTWDSTPYHRLPMRYRHFELMHLLDGSVSFQDEAGRGATFGVDDVFLVEQGAQCSWLSSAHVRKVYAIYRPVNDIA